MTTVLVPLAAGCEEMEAVIVIDVLRRAGITVVVAGLEPGTVEASRGVRFVPDASFADVDVSRCDALVLPGGGPGTARLRANVAVRRTVVEFVQADKLVAAVCAAPTVLLDAGVLTARRVTAHPSVHGELERAGVRVERSQRVVADGNLVTSQGPGTCFEFAFALVERLCGAAKVAELNAGILARIGPNVGRPD
ncbi:MAG: DJ-1/PfpI family protein [Planctomycetes bacterium]|nr:DJ-1/PfpI family protein [Planctomycetota bacterium]MCC7171544.1 DJ-1/PfpI family protein [Planctomycetota bacterium]